MIPEAGPTLSDCSAAGVRFFVLDREQDLTDPTVRLYLGMSALIGAYHARNQTKKAFESRIERAKRGIPTCGKLPFARTFDKETGTWIVDEEKRAMIRDIAERYLAGESLWALASEYGQNHPNITRCLRERCGTSYTMTFRSKELAVDETITIDVPRLLPERLIREVCHQDGTPSERTFTARRRMNTCSVAAFSAHSAAAISLARRATAKTGTIGTIANTSNAP